MKSCVLQIDIQEYDNAELSKEDRSLVEMAKASCQTGYAPYSHFRVGAAIEMEDGTVVRGSNQENAAYPSGLCAERTALFYAMSAYPGRAIRRMAIAAQTEKGEWTQQPISPCGNCRQALLEYANRQSAPIRLLLYGRERTYTVPDVKMLLPLQFGPGSLTD